MKNAWSIFVCIILIVGSINPVSAQHTLWYDKPAEEWVQALPLGNGYSIAVYLH